MNTNNQDKKIIQNDCNDNGNSADVTNNHLVVESAKGTKEQDGESVGGSRQAKYSSGLAFASTKEGYTVVGIGECKDTTITIPPEYNQRAVTAISGGAFALCNHITKVIVPDSVVTIGSGE